MLLAAAFFWGTRMDEIGPFTYAASRFLLGFISLLIVWRAFNSHRELERRKGRYKSGWKAGMLAGLIMFIASSMQQVALLYTTAGKTAFITCLYIIFVPMFAALLHRRIKAENWAGAILAIIGLFLLAVHGDVMLSFGDGLVLISSFFWTAHILFIDHFANEVDAIELSTSQIGICMLLSTVAALDQAFCICHLLWWCHVSRRGIHLADYRTEICGTGSCRHPHEF